jgi:hypothetical protein
VGAKVQQFAFGSDQQRSDINQSFLDLNTAIGQGGIQGANDEQRARIGSLLDDFADVEIPGAGGKTGRELKGEFAEQEALRLGLPPEIAAAAKDKALKGSKEEQLIGQLAALGQQEKAAATALVAQTNDQIKETIALRDALIANTAAQLAAAGEKAATDSNIQEQQKRRDQTAQNIEGVPGTDDKGLQQASIDATAQAAEATKTATDANLAAGEGQDAVLAATVQDQDQEEYRRRVAEGPAAKEREKEREKAREKEIRDVNLKAGGFRASGGMIYREEGGSIFQSRGTDTVPAMLTPGEFVMRRSAVQKYGTGFMRSINNGSMPGFRRGGLIGTGNVQYRQNGGSINGGGGLMIDPSGISQVLENFNAMFASSLDNIIQAMSSMTGAVNNLANTFSQGMVINHNFTGDLSLAFRIDNAEQLKTAVADAIVPRISEIITEQIDNRLNRDFKSGG